jgi:hypothetical protein
VTVRHQRRFLSEILAHFNIKNEMTLNVLTSGRQILLRLLPFLKRWPNILHIFANSVPPQGVAVFLIKRQRLFNSLG